MSYTPTAAKKRTAIVGCKHTTLDLILSLQRQGVHIDHCVTLGPEKAREQQVAGYMDLRPFLESAAIPYTSARKYNLRNAEDRARLPALDLDIILVMGWQRLIPDWWLEALSIGAFGMHGSSLPLPHGRGRSPLNWSLIQNQPVFYTHLFQYLPEIDNGPIVGVQTFDITPFDTSHTLHLKNTLAMIRLCGRYLPELLNGTATLTPQPTTGASYYPKRTAEDGLIYWTDNTQEIYNLIRAVTRPFPGAFTFLDDDPEQKVMIWQAIPFDTHLTWPDAVPGEIVAVFYDGTFVVTSSDSSLLVLESSNCRLTHADIGRRFGHLQQPRKVWTDLPQPDNPELAALRACALHRNRNNPQSSTE